MRRWLVTAVFAFVILAMLAPPVFAQAPAGPPAPKVTITGTFDQMTTAGRNFYDGNFTRDNDREWYARTRFRPDFEFAVGRTKAVLGIEIDLNYGQTGSNDGGFPGNNTGQACGFAGGCKGAGSAGGGLDINTDVAGLFEVKWIYTEFDLTGKDSLLPFIPILTVARAGGQPFATIANYKVYYANGDFAGLDLYSTFTPDIKNHLAFVIVEDQLAGGNRSSAITRTSRGEDYAFIISPEITPFKGLDLKPMFSWFHADGLTAGAARRNASNPRTVGGAMNVATAVGGGAPAGDSANTENRYTAGLDARLRIGPFGLDPTVSYQWGHYDTQALRTNGTVGKVRGEASAWLLDVIGSYQLGPLLIEARGAYSTGNKARDNLSQSKRYYEPLDLDTGYWSGGWLGILGLGVDYFNGGGPTNQGMDTNIGYDRYGRMQAALRVTYSITPALSVYGVVAPTWSAEKVDTDTGCPALNVATSATGCPARVVVSDKSFVTGDSRYIGTEINGGFTWRFAANTAFDLAGYYLSAGPALKLSEVLNGTPVKRDQHDGYYASARVRLSF
ncbi:MAG: hypothetical protein DMD75_13645 [Candidatus Rokuibacteriota bacterium]|nr:MAG: hypothetical protein DMD75_13645 [Candidatus Rokubacteria bacterium]